MPTAIFAALLVLIFLSQGLAFVRANSQTSDEAVHLAAGYSYLARGDFRLNAEHPPLIKEIAAASVYLLHHIPFQPDERLWRAAEEWRIGRDFLYRSPVPWNAILFAGRMPNLILGALLLCLIGWWSRRLWGDGAALLAMALGAFEPNLLASASLITTDLGAALFIFLAMYLLWEHAASPSWPLLAGAGAAIGLALCSKFSTVLLVPVAAIVVLSHVLAAGGEFNLPGALRDARDKTAPGAGERLSRAVTALALLFIVAILVIPIVYFFQGFSTWWNGFSRVLAHQEGGHQAFFLGEYSTEGWWSYFPVAFLIKTPVGTLLLLAAALLFWRAGAPLRRKEAIFLLLPVAIFFLAAMRGRINIGLRHILPVYPLLFVAASRLATVNFRRRILRAFILGVPAAFTAVSCLRVAPHQLAYFNELVGGPRNGPRYLSDSNIDWGQDLGGLKKLMDERKIPMIYLSYFGNAPPAALGIRHQYAPAFGHLEAPPPDVMPLGLRPQIIAISVCSLQGVHLREKDLYAWLAKRTPIGSIGYSLYLYDLTDDAGGHLELAKTYLRAGPQSLALPELQKVLALDPSNAEAARLLASLGSGS